MASLTNEFAGSNIHKKLFYCSSGKHWYVFKGKDPNFIGWGLAFITSVCIFHCFHQFINLIFYRKAFSWEILKQWRGLGQNFSKWRMAWTNSIHLALSSFQNTSKYSRVMIIINSHWFFICICTHGDLQLFPVFYAPSDH